MGKGRRPCCDKASVKKGPWSQAEDFQLISFIQKHGHENWRSLPKFAGLARCGKSCRLRWVNYLRPDLKRGDFTPHEEEAIIKLHEELGNQWSKIASKFLGRTDNEIKNVWNTHLKKRVKDKKINKKSQESCKSLQTSTSTNEAPDGFNKDCCSEQHLVHQTITMDDSVEHPSSSSTSYNSQISFSDHEMEDFCPILDHLGSPRSDLIENNYDKDKSSVILGTSFESNTLEELIGTAFEPKYPSSSSTAYYSTQVPYFGHEMVDFDPILDDLGADSSNIFETTYDKDEVRPNMGKSIEYNTVEEPLEIPFEPNLDLWDFLDGDHSNSVGLSDVPFSEVENGNTIGNNIDSGRSWWWSLYLENELGLNHNEATSSNTDLCYNCS